MKRVQLFLPVTILSMNGERSLKDRVVASAIIDRLMHHAHLVYINGNSYRLKGKLKKEGIE